MTDNTKLRTDEEVGFNGQKPIQPSSNRLRTDEEVGFPPQPRGFTGALKDTGSAIMGGLAGLVKSASDLYGVATGDMNNVVSQTGQNAQEYWDEAKSADLRAKMQARKKDIDSQDSTLGKAWAAVKDTVTDPALAMDTVAQNAATMIPGAVLGRAGAALTAARGFKAAQALGPVSEAAMGTIAQQAGKVGTAAAIGAGAVQQGADVSGDIYADMMKKPDSVWDANPDFAAAVQRNGGNRDAAKQELATRGAQAAFVPGTAVSVAANGIPGATMLERALVGGAARDTVNAGTRFALPKAIAKGALGEGTQEFIEEGGGKLGANIAARQIVDPNQDVWNDVGENAGMGFAGGALMGGASGPFHAGHGGQHGATSDAHGPGQGQGQGQSAPSAESENRNSTAGAMPSGSEAGAAPGAGGVDTTSPVANSMQHAEDSAPTQPIADAARPQRPSEAAGIDPNAGSLSAGAAIALDSGVSQQMQQAAVAAQSQQDVTARKDQASTEASLKVDPDTGEVTQDLSSWSDQKLRDFFQGAASSSIRRKLATELSRRRTEREQQQGLQAALDSQQNAPEPTTTINNTVEQTEGSQKNGTQAEQGGTQSAQTGAAAPGMERGATAAGGAQDAAAVRKGASGVAGSNGAAVHAAQVESPDVSALREQLRSVEGKILHAAPDYMAQGGGDIESAMKSRKVPVTLKVQRQKLKGKLEQAKAQEMRLFPAESGTLGVPRSEMPQVPAQSHGGLVQHLNAKGISHETTMVDAGSLKPTQAEYSPAKVQKAKSAMSDRSVIVSNDGHIIDGHHQAVAAAEEGKPVKAIVLDAPVEKALQAVKDSPSALPTASEAPSKTAKTERSTYASKEDVEHLFGIDKKRAAAIERVNSQKGVFFMSEQKAHDFIQKNGLDDGYAVVQQNRAFFVKKKAIGDTPHSKDTLSHEAAIRSSKESGSNSRVAEEGQGDELDAEMRSYEAKGSLIDWGNKKPAKQETSDPFAGNKLFTSDKVAAARERMRKKLGTLNSGIDPEMLVDGMTIAGAYIESGVRNFTQYAKAMIEDMGEGVKPYLLSFWEGARNYPGLNTEGMTNAAESSRQHQALLTPDIRSAASDLGKEVQKPLKRTRKTGAKGDMTLTQDWGVDHIDGYGDGVREIGNETKDAFLKEAKQYLTAVADVLSEADFEPHQDSKGRPGKAVHVNESGMAGSGDVTLTMHRPDTGTNIYIHVGDTALRGMFPSTQSGIAVMARMSQAADDRFASQGQNHWMPVDLSASDLATHLLETARGNMEMAKSRRNQLEGINGTPEQAGRAEDQGRAPEVSGRREHAAQPDTAPADSGHMEGEQPKDVPATADAGHSGGDGLRGSAKNVGRTGSPDEGRNASDGRTRAGRAGQSDAGAGRRASGPDGLTKASKAAVEKAPDEMSPANPGAGDFHIDNPLEIVGGGQVARFEKNQAAIELLNKIREESRSATADEQRTLAGYTGWGSYGQELFQGTWEKPMPKPGWEARDRWLRDQLGEDEWKSAQRSITNAHYTDPPTVMAMWGMVKRMGFAGGRVLEPSMGIGNFFGMMPQEVKSRSQLAGIELDELTGSMAKLLYPKANIKIMGYQESKTPDNFYDLVIGNWPFENTVIADRRYNTLSPFLHDYFFLKALDQVRPGGLVVGITSNGTMDKKATKIRAALARKAELVTSIRLPSGAFQEYAGTKVVTDIVILKKREHPLSITPNEPWINSVAYKTPAGPEVFINEFYAKNPGNVIGTTDYGHGTTRMQPGMIVHRPDNMDDRLRQAVEMVPEGVFSPENRTEHISYITNHTADREGSLTDQDGTLYVVRGEHLAPAQEVQKYKVKSESETAKREQQLHALIDMRRKYAALIEAERTGESVAPRTALRTAYEAFTAEHGDLGDSFGLQYLHKIDDPFYPALAALTIDGRPSAILTESTMRGARAIKNPTAQDAYVLARNKSVQPTLAEIAELAGKPEAEVRAALLKSGAVFEAPNGDIVPSDIYLSGNVRKKLREARAELEAGNKAMERNVSELQKIIPADIPYFNIESQLGATWVPAKTYADYVAHMLNKASADGIEATFINGRWKIRLPDGANHLPEARTGFGTSQYPFSKLVNAAFTNQTVKIRRKDSDGKEYVDTEATDEANARISDIRTKFGEWLWSDPERRADLEGEYNEVRNAYATPKFDGSFLSFEGMALSLGNGPFNLRQHQSNAIWRAIVNRRSINAHEVGTGKTFTMGGIAVESRRYGIAKKPMILAHNANSATVGHEIQMMYPAAKVLYVDNLSPNTIAVKMRQIANDDWDAVVLPHSLIDRLSFREETLMEMAKDDIRSLEEEAYAAAEEDGVALDREMLDDEEKLKTLRSVTAKELVKSRNRIIETIKKQAMQSSREGAIPFEDLGIDMVLVDEAHEFKKPPISTRMNMKGLNTQTSNRSIALQFITRYIRSHNFGGNVHTFTGTPITNTLTEIYHQMRYVMEDEMKEAGVDSWDGWFGSFAKEVQDVELSAAGEYEAVNRLAGFINVPELRRMIGQYMDVVFADDMPEMQPRKVNGKTMASENLTEAERAELLNGRTEGAENRPYKKVVNVTSDLTPEQSDIFSKLQGYARAWRNMNGKQRKEAMANGAPESPIITEGMANKASFDVRLTEDDRWAGQEGNAPDDPGSKASKVVHNVLEVYNSDPRAAQVIFSDMGYSTSQKRSMGRNEAGDKVYRTVKTFSTMRDIVERLVQGGIPREQIAIVDGSTSKEKRKEIADAVNNLGIRVVIGSTDTLGVGVNMQRNLRAMHHMDAPYMPGELEQRNGRGMRQGNQWNTVLEYRYMTDRLDGRRWQILAIKQRFINAFMKANDKNRVIEGDAASDEESDILKSFSEAAGDPRILIRAKLKKNVEALQRAERMHGNGVAEARRALRTTHEAIEWNRGILQSMTEDNLPQRLSSMLADQSNNFRMEVRGTQYDTRADAGNAIDQFLANDMRMEQSGIKVGSYRNVPVTARWPSISSKPELVLKLDGQEFASSSLRGLEQQMRNYPQRIEKVETNIAQREASIQRLEEVSKAPFARASDLELAQKRLTALEKDIEVNPVPPPAWLRAGAPVDSEAFRNGKPFVVTGHRWTKEGWFVLGQDAKGEMAVPYMDVNDAQGIPLYEEREFHSPEVIEKNGNAPAVDAAASEDEAYFGTVGQTETPEFKRWFGDSKVVDAEGKPLMVYHGSADDFSAFDAGRLGDNTQAYDAAAGFHFADNRADADHYAIMAARQREVREGGDGYGAQGVVRPFYLSLQRPLIVGMDDSEGNAGERTQEFLDDKLAARDYANANGMDGIVYLYGTNVDSGYTAIAFRPEQIKSATGNNGNFDPADPDISHAGVRHVSSRTGTTTDRAIMAMARDGKPASDILSLVAETSRNRFNRQVARLLMKAGVAPKVELLRSGELGYDKGGFALLAKYSRVNDAVSMTIGDRTQAQAEQIFLHEMIHAATLKALDRSGLQSLQMRRLYDHVKQQGGAAGQYGMKNVGEFVAEAFTNPEFQQALRSMSAPKGSVLKSAWHQFVRILRSILGLPQGSSSALSQALEIGVNVMREDAALRRNGRDAGAESDAFAQSAATRSAFEARIDALFKGGKAITGTRVLDRSDVMGMLGYPDVPLMLNERHLLDGLTNHPEMTAEAWKKVPGWLENPAMVYSDPRDSGRLVVIAPDTLAGYPVMLIVEPKPNPAGSKPAPAVPTESLLVTVYAKTSGNLPAPGFLASSGNLLYVNTKNAPEIARRGGVQFPKQAALLQGRKKILTEKNLSGWKKAHAGDVNFGAEQQDEAHFGAVDMDRMKASALTQIQAAMGGHPGTVSLWDKTVGTMLNLAEKAPAFKPVFESAERFLDDISDLANDAADRAPRLLPRVDSWRDLSKRPISAIDSKAVSKPLFEGTLLWARDVDGTPVKVDELEQKYASSTADEKSRMLLRAGKIDPDVLRMWQGMPTDQFEKSVDARFKSQMLTAGVVWSDEELERVFHATPEQISLYHEARAAIDRSIDMTARADMLRSAGEGYAHLRDMVMEAPTLEDAGRVLVETLEEEARTYPDNRERIADVMDAIRSRMLSAQKLQDQGYAPLSRFGRYTVDVVDANGERQYFGMYESKRESNLALLKMKQVFPGAKVEQGTLSQEAFKLFSGVTPESLELFGNMLGLKSEGHEAIDQVFQQYLALTKNNHSALKRLIHRKGIAGYSEDVGRVLASFVYANARQASSGLNAGVMDRAINDIPKAQGELRDVAMRMRNYLRDPQEEGQAVRGMLFAQYLGGSVASAMVNMTQPFTVTLPWLSRFGGMRNAGAQLARAVKDMASGARYEPDLAAALKAAEEDGTVSPQEIHQLMAQARGAGALQVGDGTRAGNARAAVSNAWERTKVAWGQPFALAEQFNRRSTFIAAYRTAQERGMADPAGFAREAVKETQFVYSKANRPQWARGTIGGTLFCVDDTTEALTQRGWVGPDDLRPGDMLASFDLKTQRLKWSPMKSVHIFDHDGEMIHATARSLDMLMTPDHRVVHYKQKRTPGAPRGTTHWEVGIAEAKDIPVSRKVQIPTSAEFDHEPVGDPIGDELVPVLGWVVTEGCFQKKNRGREEWGGHATITQNEGENANLIRADLEAAGIPFWESRWSYKAGNHEHITFHIKKTAAATLRELLPGKHLTPALLLRMRKAQIEVLVDRMLRGDGSVNAGGVRSLIQNPGQTLEAFQMALTILGKSFSVRKHGPACRAVIIREPAKTTPGRFSVAKSERVQYKGRVWCPIVPETGTWVARRNGMPFITHNTFKTYSVSYLELLHRMWTQGGPEGKRAVAWALVMLMLMSGAGGLPFMEDLEDLVDGVGQMMGYDVSLKHWRQQALRSVVGKEMGEFLENGVSGLPGAPVDVSGRMGMGNLIPGTGFLLSKKDHTRDAMEVLGPAGDLVTRGFTGGRKFLTGDVAGAAMDVAPTAVRNAVKGADMATSGMYRDSKGYKVLDTSLAEAAGKFIGFQPRSVAQVQEANAFMQRSKSFYIDTSNEIKAQWAKALFEHDDAALAAVRKRLSDWNENNPDERIVIKVGDVWKRVREMGKDRTKRIAETSPKSLRQEMRSMAREAQ